MQSIIKIKDLVGVEQLASQNIATADLDFSGWTHVLNGTIPGLVGLTITGGSGTGLLISVVSVQGTVGDTTTLTIGDGGSGYAVGDVISVVQDSGANWTGPISFTLTEAMFDTAQSSLVTPANGVFYGIVPGPGGPSGYINLQVGVMQNNSGLSAALYTLTLSGTTGDLAKYNRVITALDRAMVKAAQNPGSTVEFVTEAGVSVTEIAYGAGGGKIPKI